MALKLTLKPNEKVIVNGAVITNGAAKTAVSIENNAVILRDKDILQEEDANTPARRVYFCVMMAYLDPSNRSTYLERFNEFAADFIRAVPTEEVRDIIVPIGTAVAAGKYFQALRQCKKLVAYEDKRLGFSDGR